MNDWIVANINNPEFDISDFKYIADMSMDNTLMLKREDYKKSEFIKLNPLFLDNDGKFSEKKFDEFYDNKLKSFLEFLNYNIPQTLELDMFDTDITSTSKTRDNNFFINRGVNPDRLKIGILGINIWSDPELSKSEIAQLNKVWDTESGKYLDYTPNDKALFNGKKDYGFGFLELLFADPLVMALYEEDGTHIDPITKQIKQHKKGDYKLNEKGTYYYETLNGRSPIGKQVLSMMDNITKEGTTINKYDFFDSDDIEKSIGGVIAKNVAALLPIFIGGPIGTVYSAALIAREMSKAMPMLYSQATALFGNYETPKWMNTLVAAGNKFTGGTSEYAKQNTFSFENFGNLISDVALLWGLQKTIANSINKLKGSKNYIDEATEKAHNLYDAKKATMGAQAAPDGVDWKDSALGQACLKKFLPEAEKAATKATLLGRDASLAYMAVVSNSDVYGSMIEHGASRREAAAVALGSTLGMFAVDKYTGIGELFFDDATGDSVKAARKAIKKEILEAGESFKSIRNSNDTAKNKFLNYIKTGIEKGKKVMHDFSEDLTYHTTGFLGKAVGEGLEEVSEELVSDTAKAMYELAGQLGLDTSVSDVGAWDNALERYSMSLFGGMLGGGVFYAKENFIDGNSFKKDGTSLDLITLIRNGHVGDLRNVLNKMKKKGHLGSTNLSAYDYEQDKDSNLVWLTTKDRSKSQNDKIAQLINDKITSIETVINNNLVNISDEKLFEQMVLSEARFAKYDRISGITNYYQDFNNVVTELIAAELDLNRALTTKEGTVEGEVSSPEALAKLNSEQEAKRQENIAQLLEKVKLLRKKKDDFLSGETSLDYTRKLNFLMDSNLHSNFLPLDIQKIWKDHFKDTTIENATEELLLKFMSEILPQALLQLLKDGGTKAWEKFKEVEKAILPELDTLSLNTPEFKKWSEKYLELLLNLDLEEFLKGFLTIDSKLDDDTEESYKFRNSPIQYEDGTVESNEDFSVRMVLRKLKIDAYNELKEIDFINTLESMLLLVGYLIDPMSARTLKKLLPRRARDVINFKIKNSQVPEELKKILKNISIDLSNIDEIHDLVDSTLDDYLEKEALKGLNNLIQETKKAYKNLENTIKEKSEIIGTDDVATYIEFLESLGFFNTTLKDLDKIEETDSDYEILQPLIEFKNSLRLLDNINNNEDIYITTELENDISGGFFFSDAVEEFKNNKKAAIQNSLSGLLNDLQRNKVIEFNKKLDQSLKNPILELLYSLAGKTLGESEVPNILEVMKIVENDYLTIENLQDFILDDLQMKSVKLAKDAIDLIQTFLYAASSTSTMNLPIGHNKVINEFAENHKDLILNWEKLPEIDSDYATLYMQLLYKLKLELLWWEDFSNDHAINKRKLFELSDAAFSECIYNLLQSKAEAKYFTVDIDGEKYNLLDGYVSDNDKAVSVFNMEKTLYKNFQNLLVDTGLTVKLLLLKTLLLEKLVDNLGEIKTLKVTVVTPETKSLTEYDILKHFALIFTQNTVNFYTNLKEQVNKNQLIAPITVLEYAARIAAGSMNLLFRDIVEYAFNKIGESRYVCSNTTVCYGAAGAGKTLVVAKYAKNSLDPDSEILIAGPTPTQAHSLQKSLGLSSGLTTEQLLKNILGEQMYINIKDDIDKATEDSTNKYFDHFTAFNGFDLPRLKNPEKIKFNKLEKTPKLIIIDEATHIPALFIQILDLYAKLVGAQVLLLGDRLLNGYEHKFGIMENSDDIGIVAIRTPELSVSLRDNNILKLSNLEIVRNLLSEIQTKYAYLPTSEAQAYIKTVSPLLKNIHLHNYNLEEITGDLITSSITPDIVQKLKREGKTVGFIGKPESSPAYKVLKEADLILDLNANVLDYTLMLGLEFDYVIIDYDFKQPLPNHEVITFLKNLYTLMSRSTTASLFIDNGLSSIIGESVEDSYTAKAVSLNDKIDGVSAVDSLRTKKLKFLSKLDLTPIELKGKIKKDSSNKEESENNASNPDDIFIDPEKLKSPKVDKAVQDLVSSDEDYKDAVEGQPIDNFEELIVESWSDVTYLGVGLESDHTKKGSDNKEYTNDLWKIDKPKDGPLRNLLAILDDADEAFWYKDKQSWMRKLFQVKSAIMFDVSWDDTVGSTREYRIPSFIRSNFSKEDWENGEYAIEIRDASLEVRPIGSTFKLNGLEYNGKLYSVNIVYKVKNNDGRDCIFDISAINDPQTLKAKLPEIKLNILKKLDSGKIIDLATKDKLQRLLNSLDNESDRYGDLFKRWIDSYNENKSFYMKIPKEKINHHKYTWFKKRKGPNIRLGGSVNPNTLEKDNLNLKYLNPHMVFSKTYIFGDKNSKLTEVDPSVLGKCVVFVSSNLLLKEHELIDRYIEQKKNPNSHTPEVRMLVLGNYGLSTSLLASSDFALNFAQEEDPNRMPIRQNHVGMQMFVSMWNFRASLKKFKLAYVDFVKSDFNKDESKLKKVILALHYIFKNGLKGDAIKTYLNSQSLTLEDLDKLNKFNFEICKDIPIFRLGYSEKNGFHVQQFELENSNIYKDKKVNLLCIDPEKVDLFDSLLSDIFLGILEGDVYNPDSLNLKFLKLDKDGNKVAWKPDEIINLENTEHKRSIKGLMDFAGGTISIKHNGIDLAFPEGNTWSLMPRLICSIINTTTYFQYHPDEMHDEFAKASIVMFAGEENGEKKYDHYSTLIGTWLKQDNSGLLKVGSPDDLSHPDRSLIHMFDLIFHGTVDNIHKLEPRIMRDVDGNLAVYKPQGEYLLLLTDAVAPKGWFSHPDIHTFADKSNGHHYTDPNDNTVIFYESTVLDGMLTCDVDMRASGIGINLTDLSNATEKLFSDNILEEKDEEKNEGFEYLKNEEESYGENLGPNEVNFANNYHEIYKYIQDNLSYVEECLGGDISDDDYGDALEMIDNISYVMLTRIVPDYNNLFDKGDINDILKELNKEFTIVINNKIGKIKLKNLLQNKIKIELDEDIDITGIEVNENKNILIINDSIELTKWPIHGEIYIKLKLGNSNEKQPSNEKQEFINFLEDIRNNDDFDQDFSSIIDNYITRLKDPNTDPEVIKTDIIDNYKETDFLEYLREKGINEFFENKCD